MPSLKEHVRFLLKRLEELPEGSDEELELLRDLRFCIAELIENGEFDVRNSDG